MKFIINTRSSWYEPPRARHQVAQALSKQHRVIFVARNEFGTPKFLTTKISDNLLIVTPYWPLDFRVIYRIPIINEIYQYWLFKRIYTLFGDVNVINFDFTASRIFDFFSNVIFYCNDDFTAISKNKNLKLIYKYHLKTEKKVAEKSDFCIATSEFLRQKLKKYNKYVFEIALGGPDIKEYKIKINYSVDKINDINIGFIGFIERFNLSFDIIDEIMKQPEFRLTLVGPINKKYFADLLGLSDRVVYKGVLIGEKLYNEINKFDVAIVPYNLNSNSTRTPNKLWQYLALGKPVVISNLPSIQEYNFPDGIIYKASTVQEFGELIMKAMEENNHKLIHQRVRMANKNTWDKKAAQILSIYDSFNRS